MFSFSQQSDKLTPFLLAQNKIRVVIDDAGNYGNQAASYNLILKIRQLGFRGKFEIVYFDDVKDKIIKIFNLLKSDSDNFNSTEHGIEFIGLNSFLKKRANGEVDPLALGVSGAVDAKPKDWSKEILDDNFANVLNVDSFVLFSPYYNIDDMCNTKIYLRNHKKPVMQDKSCQKMLITPIASFSDASDYLFHSQQGQDILRTYPGLKSLIKSIDNKSINFQSLYGWTLRESPSNLLNIILGASYAQMYGGDHLKKPLIMGAFFDLQYNNLFLEKHDILVTNEDVLLNLIFKNCWSDYNHFPGADRVKRAIKNLDLRNRLKIINNLNEETQKIIDNLQPNEILLVTLPSLPKKIFDGLYTHHESNILPPVREGASSLTSLLSVTGKPHIHCRSLSDWEINLNDADAQLRSRLEKLNNVICREFYGFPLSFQSWNDDNLSELVGNYIIDAMNPNSELAKYFVKLKQEALHSDNDRITSDLNSALDLLNIILPAQQPVPEKVCKVRNSSTLIHKMLMHQKQSPNNFIDRALNVAIEYASSVVKECPSYFNSHLYTTQGIPFHFFVPSNPSIGACQVSLPIAGLTQLNLN